MAGRAQRKDGQHERLASCGPTTLRASRGTALEGCRQGSDTCARTGFFITAVHSADTQPNGCDHTRKRESSRLRDQVTAGRHVGPGEQMRASQAALALVLGEVPEASATSSLKAEVTKLARKLT